MKIAPITIALAIIFSFLVWGRHTENIDVFIGTSLPAGQRFYLISKLSALVALAILFVQISLMLFKRYVPAGRRIVWPQRSHQLLGIVTFVLVLIHSISFITAASFRGGAPAFSLLLPNFQTGLYNTAVSLGLLAFYLFHSGCFIEKISYKSRPKSIIRSSDQALGANVAVLERRL